MSYRYDISGGAMHYHVTINGDTPTWAHIARTEAEAAEIHESTERLSLDLGYPSPCTVETVPCEDEQECGLYRDLVSYEAYTFRIGRDDEFLATEHARMILESDGHGPV